MNDPILEFTSGRAAVTDLAEINETLHPIGFGLWPLDVGAAPDAIHALLAQPTLTDDEAAPVLQRFLLPREQLLEVVAAAGRAPQVAGGGELSTFDATNGVTYPQLFVIAPGVDYTRFDHFHFNSATGGGGLDEVLQVLSGGGVQVRQHLPDEGEFVVTIDCPTPQSGWLLTYDGGRPHIGSFSSAQPGTKVLVQAIGPPQWEVTYVES